MKYKEALFFIGKCLTIGYESGNREFVSEQIKTQKVDWDIIVQISTAHYVFPALYIALNRSDLLSYLPKELVYQKHWKLLVNLEN